MSNYNDHLIILLRKILAISMPEDFEATEDTTRSSLLNKLKAGDETLYKAVNDFLIAFESFHFIASDYQLKLKAADIWKTQKEMFEQILTQKKILLETICKKQHISIEYELGQLFD